ncbi:MAG: putative undecaprenyl-phosphate glycosylphosphotransferase [Acidimicrobiia bacterium]|nr:putative undecaprenyl-phosphate glycosylphosphotransferase [Acidimicrobiia bacterium]
MSAEVSVGSGLLAAADVQHPVGSAVDAAARTRRISISPKLALVIADLASATAAMFLAIQVSRRYDERIVETKVHQYVWLTLASMLVWPVIFSYSKLYSVRFVTRTTDEVRRIVHSAVIGTVVLTFLAALFKITVPRLWILSVLLLVSIFLGVERGVARRIFSTIRRKGGLLRHVVIVGGNAEALEIAYMLEDDASLGYQVRGFVDVEPGGEADTAEQTLAVVRETGSTGVVVAATAIDLGTSNRLIRELTDRGIHVELSSTLRDIASHRLTVRPLGRFPVVYVEPVQRSGWRPYAKRTLDLVLACGALVATAPLLAIAALVIKIDDRGGPVLFRQKRVGRDGKLFEVLKLRTMVTDAEERLLDLSEHNEADGPLFKMRNDPRVTRPGAIMRKLSIDELPQLWNVIRNEMSMVGPRPALPSEVEKWGSSLHSRLRVKPGITGMWQVNGRSSSSFEDYERLDLYYVDNWSLTTDLVIVAKTIPAVLFSKGAY